ncbi:MAG: hypothetical protein O7F12_12535 [Nitrospirae bacterium]|nr:hypothetical protein [Nitrospirota bacterium]
MIPPPKILINSVLGSMAMTAGLWLLWGGLPSAVTVILVVGLSVILGRISPTVPHVWAWSTCVMGIESLAWPFMVMGSLGDLGPEPSLEDMQQMFSAVLFGVFSGIFWLTFAYGIYRRIHNRLHPVKPPSSDPRTLTKAQRKKKRQKSS